MKIENINKKTVTSIDIFELKQLIKKTPEYWEVLWCFLVYKI